MNAQKYEDYLRQKAEAYGTDTRGVVIPKSIAIGIAEYIENNRGRVEVIRCKDCRHFNSYYTNCDSPHWDMAQSCAPYPTVYRDDYCSRAERKEE